jgi:hypothetical protein
MCTVRVCEYALTAPYIDMLYSCTFFNYFNRVSGINMLVSLLVEYLCRKFIILLRYSLILNGLGE